MSKDPMICEACGRPYPLRCDECHPVTGVQCGLPQGHGGSHQNAYLTPIWDTIKLTESEKQEVIQKFKDGKELV